MPLNIECKTSHYQFDETGMLVVLGDSRSWRDSVGRTVLAWIAYGRPKELQEAIEKCYNPKYPLAKYSLRRHPFWQECASRDHWSYFIIYRRLRSDDYWFQCFALSIPRMRGMNYWMKALTGNKRAEWLYYTLYIPGAYLGNWWLRVCRKWGRIEPEFSNNDWVHKMNSPLYGKVTYGWLIQKERTFWQKLWANIIFQTIPAFALHNKAWQIYFMPESEKKERLKKVLLRRVGQSNILVRLFTW